MAKDTIRDKWNSEESAQFKTEKLTDEEKKELERLRGQISNEDFKKFVEGK